MSELKISEPPRGDHTIVCRYRSDQAALQAFLQETFNTVAVGDPSATFGLEHADGGRQTFTARFGSGAHARAFRLRLAAQPDADGCAEPRLAELERALSAANAGAAPG